MTSARKKILLAGQLGRFVQQYGRKAQRGVEPNDRRYSARVEEQMKKLSPEELSELLSGEVVESAPLITRKQKPDADPFSKYKKK